MNTLGKKGFTRRLCVYDGIDCTGFRKCPVSSGYQAA